MRTQSGFDVRYQVKQYVAVVKGAFARFRVFETGDSKFYLFSMIDDNDCDTGLQWPVRKKDLRDDVRRALAHGYGNG